MYSYEERMKAVQLYIKYEHSLASVIQELGYPSPKALYKWFKEYEKNGDLPKTSKRRHQFTHEEKQFAVDHYIEFGRNYSRTVRMLGYPDRNLLSDWCKELAPEARKIRRSKLNYSQEQKKEAVIHLVSRKTSVRKIAEHLQITRKTLYDWKQELIGEELPPNMSKIPNNQNTEELKDEVDTLKRQVYQLRMEKDILEKSAELIKKDIGINPKDLSNKKKARVIDALSETYPLKDLLKSLNVAKSSYFYHRSQLKQSDKYSGLRVLVKEIFTENQAIYGYRRIHSELKNRKIIVSEKVVRRLMKEEKLTVRFVSKKKYNSYAGEIVPATPNVIERDFTAEAPNEKWLTDITEFRIPAGKVYLSPIIDCFDGIVVSWSISTQPNAELVNSMLDQALSSLAPNEKPIVHSDRGAHYRWPGWLERIETNGLIQSMSKKGCSPDNAACEGFFGRLKNEFFYGLSWKKSTIDDFIHLLDRYIHWYNNKRIKQSLGGISPLQYRKQLGLIA